MCPPGTHLLPPPPPPLTPHPAPAGKAAPQPAEHPRCCYAPAASLATLVQPLGTPARAHRLCQLAAAEGWQPRARGPRRSSAAAGGGAGAHGGGLSLRPLCLKRCSQRGGAADSGVPRWAAAASESALSYPESPLTTPAQRPQQQLPWELATTPGGELAFEVVTPTCSAGGTADAGTRLHATRLQQLQAVGRLLSALRMRQAAKLLAQGCQQLQAGRQAGGGGACQPGMAVPRLVPGASPVCASYLAALGSCGGASLLGMSLEDALQLQAARRFLAQF